MKVHQVVVAAAPHDAILNHAFGLQASLSTLGKSEVFARHIDPVMERRVRPLMAFPTDPVDAVVFHASIGEAEVTDFLLSRSEPLVVVYHNITPPEFFDSVDAAFADLLRAGRDQLLALRERTVMALGVSEYNAADLRDAGFSDVAVSPLVLGDRLAIEPDPATADALAALGGPVFLFVGQLLPHKRPDFLLQAFHILRTYLAPTGVLVLAGTPRLERYASSLRQFSSELALPGVWFTGEVSDAALSALYAGADVFVTASEHEGFCVPLVEAMTAGLPIVARDFAAVPDTLDGAGLVLAPYDGPTVFAEAMLAAAMDQEVRGSLMASSRRRADEFAAVDARAIFLGHLRRALG